MGKDYDELVEAENNLIVIAKEDMGYQREKFKELLCEFLKKWFYNNAKELIVSHSIQTAKLTNEELGIVKNEIQELISHTTDIVERYFDKDDLWWDLFENDYSYEVRNDQLPPIISEELKYILGKLGMIFEKYRIVKITPEHEFKSVTQDTLFLINKTKRDEPYYRTFITVDKDILNTFTVYFKLLNSVKSSRSKIQKIIEEKRKNVIGDLWDSL